ncbi:hypothetical protein [Paenibacillus arenosi]|uniref:DUF2140 domain-containing protein n=1 Tax=Paenibacillus arenosi TaxID=2774142 RepID=A0ABR9B1X5_9BACL|nr:hypothetical protein [Paenibacillus arenosi]MBD8499417.1 hypothetical protein [Paenibacillus arenosi]
MAKKKRSWLLRIIISVFLLVIVAGICLYFYVQPDRPIGWQAMPGDNIPSILKRVAQERSREITISEQEWNQYASIFVQRLLQQKPEWSQWNVQGMNSKLLDDQIHVTLHLRPWDMLDAEFHIYLDVNWDTQTQTLLLAPSRVTLKHIPLPHRWLEQQKPLTFDLRPYLPSLIQVEDIRATTGQWTIRFGLTKR